MEIRRLSAVDPEEAGGDVQESTVLKREGIVGDIGDRVVTVSEVTFRPGERTRLHTHDYGQVLYVTRGEGVVATVDETHTVCEGDLIFVPPDEVHWHGTARDDPVEFAHITYVVRDAVGEGTTAVGDIVDPAGE